MAQFACEDVNCAVAIGRETMPQTVDDERIRTVSVSWPVHPALDEIIQELEDKLELKPDPTGLLSCQIPSALELINLHPQNQKRWRQWRRKVAGTKTAS